MTTSSKYDCPTCGREGAAYVCRADYWRYVCSKGHSWRVEIKR